MRPIFKYLRDDGTIDDVEQERWCWEVIYRNNQILKQFDSDGVFHQVREIRQPFMETFRMVNYDTGRAYEIRWKPEYKLIHFYPNFVLNINKTNPSGTRVRLYSFGYTVKIRGIPHTMISTIMPDDSVLITDNPNDISIISI